MEKDLSNVPVGQERAKFLGIARGKEKFAFLYGVATAITITCVIAFSLIANLKLWQGLLLLVGCLFVACALIFHFLEMYRTSHPAMGPAEGASDPYFSRTVSVAPPTKEPYPHHEDFKESAGFDQGQLTARIPGSTPFIDRLERDRSEDRKKKQEVSR